MMMKYPLYNFLTPFIFSFGAMILVSNQSLAQSQQPNFNLELQANVNEYPTDLYSAIWGHVDGQGREYAVIGTRIGTAIYLLEDPKKPRKVAFIPGSRSIWREMKSYKDYVYVTIDNVPDGLLIINMKNAPDNITWNLIKPQAPIDPLMPGLVERCHTIWIDENGVMYLSGCNVNRGAVVMYDLKANPESPKYLGALKTGYSHDNFARGDTVWSSDIYDGKVSIVDAKNKANPVLLNSITTTSRFTHNSWLSDNGKYLFTTDERLNASIDAYDVSDLNNIELLDVFTAAATRGRGVVPHNTHYLKGFLPTAYYTDGVKIVDASRPTNLVEVGSYDTYPGPDGGFAGVWGIYPYFPSGLLIASDIQTGLWVFKPNYQKACFLEGLITDARTNNPVTEVEVQILAPQVNLERSKTSGEYATGIAQSGTYRVVYYKEGYQPDTLSVIFVNGKVTIQNVKLRPDGFTTGLHDFKQLPLQLSASPNPFFQSLRLNYNWQNQGHAAVLQVYNSLGKVVEKYQLLPGSGQIQIGENLPKGHYWVQVQSAEGSSKTVSVVKQ
ncbi:choice-of-anchor B family protein [Haliscomenobacter sp.]|uniref:choice-of-anchor B family protein n=1 Tax=Haliscomenobacter sp. TaxID=2717303 RepID=UPI0035945B1A